MPNRSINSFDNNNIPKQLVQKQKRLIDNPQPVLSNRKHRKSPAVFDSDSL